MMTAVHKYGVYPTLLVGLTLLSAYDGYHTYKYRVYPALPVRLTLISPYDDCHTTNSRVYPTPSAAAWPLYLSILHSVWLTLLLLLQNHLQTLTNTAFTW